MHEFQKTAEENGRQAQQRMIERFNEELDGMEVRFNEYGVGRVEVNGTMNGLIRIRRDFARTPKSITVIPYVRGGNKRTFKYVSSAVKYVNEACRPLDTREITIGKVKNIQQRARTWVMSNTMGQCQISNALLAASQGDTEALDAAVKNAGMVARYQRRVIKLTNRMMGAV